MLIDRRRPPAARVPAEGRLASERTYRTSVDGLGVHARAWTGPGTPADPPVVLVHGLGVASRMCRPVAERLALRHHVHAPDLPGFGLSDHPDGVHDIQELADDLARWMAVAGLGAAVVVGTSVGSQVAGELARRHPGRCRALVLASPTVDAGRRSWSAQLPRWQVEQATQSSRLRALQVADYARCGVRRVARTFAAALEHRPEDVVADVACPVLVCRGTRDPLVSRPWAERLAADAPHGRLAVLPGAVHALSHEHPLELSRVVERFVADDVRPDQHRS